MEALAAEHYVLAMKLRRDKVNSFDEYPFSLPVVRRLDTLKLHPAVTFLVGENGSGKSTPAGRSCGRLGFNPEGGTRNFRFGTRLPLSTARVPEARQKCATAQRDLRPRAYCLSNTVSAEFSVPLQNPDALQIHIEVCAVLRRPAVSRGAIEDEAKANLLRDLGPAALMRSAEQWRRERAAATSVQTRNSALAQRNQAVVRALPLAKAHPDFSAYSFGGI
jgi:hypothetical protein